MRRRFGLVLGCGLALCGLDAARAQDVTAGDPVGFGPKGISNTFGYRFRRAGRPGGYMPSLYMPVERNDGPEVYYNTAFNGVNGAPRADVAKRGWGFAPSWASHRAGEPRTPRHGLFGRRNEE